MCQQRNCRLLSTLIIAAALAPAGAGAWGQSDDRGGSLRSDPALLMDWCQTFTRWQAKGDPHQPTGLDCPIEGSCDIPAVRDQYLPDDAQPFKVVRMHLLIFRQDNGGDPASTQAGVEGQMEQLNLDFAPWRFSFEYTWEFVDDSTYRYGGNDTAMKAQYAVDPEHQCNVFVIDTGGGSYGTFPWDTDALTDQGGIVMHEFAFGPGASILTHEAGHNLGLWHTHHGVSEVSPCSPCYERADGAEADTTGDLCSDTPGTPVNFSCSNPGGTDPCSGVSWGETLVESYMSYGSGCWDRFTPQQASREHCWTDLIVRSWLACPLSGGHQKLGAGGAVADRRFGTAVAASGSTAVIGADGDAVNGADAGAAVIFTHNGSSWVEQQDLRPDDGAAGDRFGQAVAVSGDAALIGAAFDDDDGADAGSAYVFRFDGADWAQEQKLLAADAPDDQFGWTVALGGEIAVIGAPGDDEVAADAGAAYVFRFDGAAWVEEQKLLAPDGAASDTFGFSAAVSGDVAVIGAYLDDDLGSGTGAAYVFRFDGASWLFEQKLSSAEGSGGDLFGSTVAVDGETAVVGAYRSNTGLANTGVAIVYRFDGASWVEEGQLYGGTSNERFGFSVAVSGVTVVVGTPWDHDSGPNAGAASGFAFDGSSWSQGGKLLAADGNSGDELGYGVAVSDAGILLGAPFHDEGGTDTGAVYAFGGAFPFDCNGNGIADGCDIADGTSPDLNANGIPDECDCPEDLDGDGNVGTTDLLTLLELWGTDPGGPPDFDGDGNVGTPDLLVLLAGWGPCL